ncbi:hypothetical protein M316_0067 [Nitrincola phage 1M3-16]|uniref:hypothetical protein n=1 Tax=Nitrincola phage 1M3-16 TaxID=1472912 RepID=UPI000444D5B2|nr:hypothetical protein GJ22_gp085 [Nitrincola phage 1M3-16]AHX01132.1 hypothetical protein M316_0067 [Nitrincola phage 1M3-16]
MALYAIFSHYEGIIGVNGDLLKHDPEDLKFFREKTMGKKVIMGRTTVESLPRKLDGRHVICLTRQEDYQNDKCDEAMDLDPGV